MLENAKKEFREQPIDSTWKIVKIAAVLIGGLLFIWTGIGKIVVSNFESTIVSLNNAGVPYIFALFLSIAALVIPLVTIHYIYKIVNFIVRKRDE